MTVGSDGRDEALIAKMLGKMPTRFGEVVEYRKAQEGVSGASSYWIKFPQQEAFLKIALAGYGAVVTQRARREFNFYQSLAHHTSLRVPKILGMHEDAEGIGLLMAAYQPSPPPQEWKREDYLEAARQLGRFHTAFWGKTEILAQFSWLDGLSHSDFSPEIQQGRDCWQVLFDKPQLKGVLTEMFVDLVNLLLAQPEAIQKVRQSLPITLCHGDCTTLNVLRDESDHFVWADWQEVRVGYGPEDLSFFYPAGFCSGRSSAARRDDPALLLSAKGRDRTGYRRGRS